ncbi:GIY-YIG nuclease family protein [Sphingobium sp. PAMC28499]|uniref:GIY-YIG nuclease family protein n=1 Tax=Sphingobium sp. PAMC28499 TaxID=2565554 RepID=UPI00109E32F8|nr:GIY-YIG nuclease family protein [Sphingobium sp. PAMC28499]QCB38525.1 GIY-YIG nuclease family protein [Sphingobium sp. PAMC28499]
MGLTFNAILDGYGIDPRQVRLLRHQNGAVKGRTLYSLWRDDHPSFIAYQNIQSSQNRSRLTSPYWAAFIVTPAQSNMFVGLYEIERIGECPEGMIDPFRLHDVTGLDLYRSTLVGISEPDIGRIFIDWGPGTRTWAQKAADQPKPILEITRTFREEEFPGYTRFIANLSTIEALPSSWLTTLGAAKGIYLLTCPRTKEQYVGSAYGEEGFLGRWLTYVRDGNGGNVVLKSRDKSDYQVSILEVCGSAASMEEIIATEGLWKAKLQTREMGLNGN